MEGTTLDLRGRRPQRIKAQTPDLQPGDLELSDFKQIAQLLSAPVSLSVTEKKIVPSS